MNGTHQVLVFAEDVNLIGGDVRTIGRHADVLLNACKDNDLAVNTGKTKYMEGERHRGMMANVYITVHNNSYKIEYCQLCNMIVKRVLLH